MLAAEVCGMDPVSSTWCEFIILHVTYEFIDIIRHQTIPHHTLILHVEFSGAMLKKIKCMDFCVSKKLKYLLMCITRVLRCFPPS
jgi:hypothetical protein